MSFLLGCCLFDQTTTKTASMILSVRSVVLDLGPILKILEVSFFLNRSIGAMWPYEIGVHAFVSYRIALIFKQEDLKRIILHYFATRRKIRAD